MESKRTKHILLSCAVIVIISCICLALIAVSGAGISLIWPFGRPGDGNEPTPVSDFQIPTNSLDVPSDNDLPADTLKMMLLVEQQVSEIRGLRVTDVVDRKLISMSELREIVTEDFFSEYTEQDARRDVQILSLLVLLPTDFDLRQFYTDLYSEQIAGFYDSEEEAMYVVQGTDFGGSEKMTYAHEFTHVLQDQVYGLEEGLGLNEDTCEDNSERCAAVTALIEGDATLTELLWFQTYATRDDYDDLMDMYNDFESPVFDSAPPYMAADLYFPYEQGLVFVELLYNDGGFAAVDAVYENPPVSTEQILHPERYPDDLPIPVVLPDLTDVLGAGWSLYDQNVMGEWYTFLILNKAYDESHRLPESLAASAAEGWGGDSYAFYLDEDSDDVVFVFDAVWDTNKDADEFVDAFVRYADLRWETAPSAINDLPAWEGSDSSVIIWQEGARTVWVVAPSAELVELILLELQ